VKPAEFRKLIALCALVACKAKQAPQPPPPDPDPVPATPDAQVAVTLPDGFPARGAATVSGTLAGKHFDAKKAVLRISGGANLALYNWSEGQACEPQFAPNADQLYIQVMAPEAQLVAGVPLVSRQHDVHAIYKRPTLDPVQGDVTTVVIDELTATHATGRLLLTGPDETKAAGSFDAVVCSTPQRAAGHATEANGMHWGDVDVDPATLPAKPVTAVLLGKPGTPVAIEVVDWDGGDYSQHEVHFFLTKPAKPCQFDQMSPGFKIGFHGAIAAGNTIKTRTTLVTHTGDPFGVALWDEPGNVVGNEGGGWISARIDAVSPTEVRGRVFAWFDDASKSMIAGAFTAKNCNIHP
jgi:hypothetical protein